MKGLVVVTEAMVERPTLDRVIRGIGYLPRAFDHIDLAPCDPKLEGVLASMPGHAVVAYRPGDTELGYDAVFYMSQSPRPRLRSGPGHRPLRTYTVLPWGEISRDGPADEFDYPHFDKHSFNRLGPRRSEFRFFPHVHTELRTGLGPTDEFGHRIALELDELSRRGPDHKVIAVFGGSSTWSIFVQHDEMFTHVLEELLNRGNGHRYTVLNFGMQAATILHEMISYLLFCADVRPDVVIAHDGFNDLANGQITDPYLLNRYRLTYYAKSELWAQMLHHPGDPDLSRAITAGYWQGGPTPPGAHPRAIVAAYLRRRRQFAEVVRAHGGTFVSGLQPILASKRAASPWERGWIDRHGHSYGPLPAIFDRVPYLYERLLGALADEVPFANVHGAFSEYGEDATLFEDFAHTVPLGERIIAAFYERFLRERVFVSR